MDDGPLSLSDPGDGTHFSGVCAGGVNVPPGHGRALDIKHPEGTNLVTQLAGVCNRTIYQACLFDSR